MAAIPDTPGLLFSLLHKHMQVFVGAISQLGEEDELFLGLFIGFDAESLGTVDHVLSHTHFHPVRNDIIVEAPSVKLILAVQL